MLSQGYFKIRRPLGPGIYPDSMRTVNLLVIFGKASCFWWLIIVVLDASTLFRACGSVFFCTSKFWLKSKLNFRTPLASWPHYHHDNVGTFWLFHIYSGKLQRRGQLTDIRENVQELREIDTEGLRNISWKFRAVTVCSLNMWKMSHDFHI